MQQSWITQQVNAIEKDNIRLREENAMLRKALEKEPEKKPKRCELCEHYIKHYGLFDGEFREVYAGHCTQGRSGKTRNQDDTCKYFVFENYKMKRLAR